MTRIRGSDRDSAEEEGVRLGSGGNELGREDRGKECRSCGRLKAIEESYRN